MSETGPSFDPRSQSERAGDAYNGESYSADEAFDPGKRKATNDWRKYLEGRPDENGKDAHGEDVPESSESFGGLPRNEDGRFTSGIKALAEAYKDASANNDKTLLGDITDEIEQRALELSEKHGKDSSGDVEGDYVDRYLERWFNLTDQIEDGTEDSADKIKDHGLEGIDEHEKEEHAAKGRGAKELREKRLRELEDGTEDLDDPEDGTDKIKDHGLEGIDRQEKEEHAARGRRAKELREKRLRELEDGAEDLDDPEDGTERKKGRSKLILGAVLGAGGLLVGAVIGGYIGNKTGVQINSPRGISEQLQAGGGSFSVLGRISARLENFFQSATGIGGDFNPAEALRSINPFGNGGGAYRNEIFENSTALARKDWGNAVQKMHDYRESFKGGKEVADRAFTSMSEWFKNRDSQAVKDFLNLIARKH